MTPTRPPITTAARGSCDQPPPTRKSPVGSDRLGAPTCSQECDPSAAPARDVGSMHSKPFATCYAVGRSLRRVEQIPGQRVPVGCRLTVGAKMQPGCAWRGRRSSPSANTGWLPCPDRRLRIGHDQFAGDGPRGGPILRFRSQSALGLQARSFRQGHPSRLQGCHLPVEVIPITAPVFRARWRGWSRLKFEEWFRHEDFLRYGIRVPRQRQTKAAECPDVVVRPFTAVGEELPTPGIPLDRGYGLRLDAGCLGLFLPLAY